MTRDSYELFGLSRTESVILRNTHLVSADFKLPNKKTCGICRTLSSVLFSTRKIIVA